MSLLLQALQKASKNREGGENNEPGPASDPLDSDELVLEPLAEPAARREAGIAGSASPSPAQAAAVMQASRAPAFDPVDYAREHYMIVFLAAAVLVAIGYGTYVYIQVANPAWLRPKPSAAPSSPLAAASPQNTPASPIATAAPESAAAKVSGMPADTPTAAGTVPGATAPAAMAPQPSNAPQPAMVAASPDAAATPASSGDVVQARQQPAATEPKPIRAAVSRPRRAAETAASQLDEDGVETVVLRSARPSGAPQRNAEPPAVAASDLMRAYEALQAGEFAQAKSLYAQVLEADSRNIDALLGLGAIASKDGRVEETVKYYQRVLELEPRNAYAQAGLIAIMGGSDPASSETRLRQLIAREPSAFLYFTLGNLYADQGQWPGAQQAYFQAYQSQPDNPDYAFNLAVGLEHLGQTRQALDYYRKALDLSFRKGRANFDQNLVIQRVGQLSSRVEQ
jgi:tetratricopeptide (TPR) repeat protein